MNALRVAAVFATLALTPACGQVKEGWMIAAEVFADPQTQQLAEAACAGDAGKVRQLLASGIPADATGQVGVTPLIWTLTCRGIEFNDMRANRAVSRGRMPPAEPVDPAYLAAMAALLEAGADPNARINGDYGPIYPGGTAYWLDGRTAVMIAAEFLEADVLRLLLAHGGDPHASEPEDMKWALSLAYDRGNWLDLGPQANPDRDWPWINLHLLLQAGARLEQTEGHLFNIVEDAARERPRLALELLQTYPYEGGYEIIVANALGRIERDFPGAEDSKALLTYLETERGVDVDAVRHQYRYAPYDKKTR